LIGRDMDILNLPARLQSLDSFLAFLLEKAKSCGASQELLGDIKLSMEELLTNIFFYAYPDDEGHVEVAWSAESEGRLRIEVTDWGMPFDPLAFKAPDLELDFAERDIGGMGIFLARQLADQMSYRRSRDANHLTVIFRLDSS